MTLRLLKRIRHHEWQDLGETAAPIAELGLAISVDPAAGIWPGRRANRCGSCCPTIRTFAGCWQEPTVPARLVSQPRLGDWPSMMKRIRDTLQTGALGR